MKFEYPNGATPLNPDDLNGLIPKHITNQKELNDWEALNIAQCLLWLNGHQYENEILTIDFIKKLHKNMLGDTWKWAGNFRTSMVNIGNVHWSQIQEKIKIICDDAKYQISNNSYSADEIAIRFHHRLTVIHPFPNGNGRHARLIADLLVVNRGENRFNWSNHNLYDETVERKKYIEVLRLADNGDYSELLKFARK